MPNRLPVAAGAGVDPNIEGDEVDVDWPPAPMLPKRPPVEPDVACPNGDEPPLVDALPKFMVVGREV